MTYERKNFLEVTGKLLFPGAGPRHYGLSEQGVQVGLEFPAVPGVGGLLLLLSNSSTLTRSQEILTMLENKTYQINKLCLSSQLNLKSCYRVRIRGVRTLILGGSAH